eukprot:snap_masked-scaffold_1-processed-gene-21.19-mRNA-1 protein AED:1.00 eAED:1.00 QI:0/0/0/0/1/1/3/0/613
MSELQLASMAFQMAKSLLIFHRATGLIHNQVNLNSFLSCRNSRGDYQIKLTQFELADVPNKTETASILPILSLDSLTPELLLGMEKTQKTDLFSLGNCLHELITFEKPFQGNSVAEIVHNIIGMKLSSAKTKQIPILRSKIKDLVVACFLKKKDVDRLSLGFFCNALKALIPDLNPNFFSGLNHQVQNQVHIETRQFVMKSTLESVHVTFEVDVNNCNTRFREDLTKLSVTTLTGPKHLAEQRLETEPLTIIQDERILTSFNQENPTGRIIFPDFVVRRPNHLAYGDGFFCFLSKQKLFLIGDLDALCENFPKVSCLKGSCDGEFETAAWPTWARNALNEGENRCFMETCKKINGQKLLNPHCFVNLKTKFIYVAAGANHVLLLSTAGELFSFGSNDFGQLGLGDDVNRTHPTLLLLSLDTAVNPNLPDFRNKFISVHCGAECSFAVSDENELFSWGNNCKGQLGRLESKENRTLSEDEFLWWFVPQRVDLEGKCVKLFSSGIEHAITVTIENEIYSWGSNNFKQTGHFFGGEIIEEPEMVDFPAKLDVKKIVAGKNFTGVLGSNSSGLDQMFTFTKAGIRKIQGVEGTNSHNVFATSFQLFVVSKIATNPQG